MLLGITSQVSHWVFVSGSSLERTQPKTPPRMVWGRLQEDARQSNLSCHREYIVEGGVGLDCGIILHFGALYSLSWEASNMGFNLAMDDHPLNS